MGVVYNTLRDCVGFKGTAPRPFHGKQPFYSVYLEEIMEWIQNNVPQYNAPIFYIYLDNNPGKAIQETLTIKHYNPKTNTLVTDTDCEVWKLPYSRYADILLTDKSTSARLFHSNIRFLKLYLNQIIPYTVLFHDRALNPDANPHASGFAQMAFDFTPAASFDDNIIIYKYQNNIYHSTFPTDGTYPKSIHIKIPPSGPGSAPPSGIPKAISQTFSITNDIPGSDVPDFTMRKLYMYSSGQKINEENSVSDRLINLVRPSVVCSVMTSSNHILFIDAMVAKKEGTTTRKSFLGKYSVLKSDGTPFKFDGYNRMSDQNYAFWASDGKILVTTYHLRALSEFSMPDTIKQITSFVSYPKMGNSGGSFDVTFLDDSGIYKNFSRPRSVGLGGPQEVVEIPPTHTNYPPFSGFKFGKTSPYTGLLTSPSGGTLRYKQSNTSPMFGISGSFQYVIIDPGYVTIDHVTQRGAVFNLSGGADKSVQDIFGYDLMVDSVGNFYGFLSYDFGNSQFLVDGGGIIGKLLYTAEQSLATYPFLPRRFALYYDDSYLTGSPPNPTLYLEVTPFIGYKSKNLFTFSNNEFDSSNLQLEFGFPNTEIFPRFKNTLDGGFYRTYTPCSAIPSYYASSNYGNMEICLIGDPYTTLEAYKASLLSPKKSISTTLMYPGVEPLVWSIEGASDDVVSIETKTTYGITILSANNHTPFTIAVKDDYNEFAVACKNNDVERDSDKEVEIPRVRKIRAKVWPRTLPAKIETLTGYFGNSSSVETIHTARRYSSVIELFGDVRFRLTNLTSNATGLTYLNKASYPTTDFVVCEGPYARPLDGETSSVVSAGPYKGESFRRLNLWATKEGQASITLSCEIDGTSVIIPIEVWNVKVDGSSDIPTDMTYDKTKEIGQSINLEIVGNSSYPHQWYVSDETVAKVEVDPDDSKNATITTLKAGTFAITVLDSAEIPFLSKDITVTEIT